MTLTCQRQPWSVNGGTFAPGSTKNKTNPRVGELSRVGSCHRAPRRGSIGESFRIGPNETTNESFGTVQVEPNLAEYPFGTLVTLTADPCEAKSFVRWTVLDPNYPGDANYAVDDANNPLLLWMDSDREVKARFKCGSGIEQALPLLTVGAGICGLTFRRMRRRG